MAFCSQCGSQLPEGARFCPKCGTDATTDAASPVSPPTSAHTPTPTGSPGHFVPPVAPGRSGVAMILPLVAVIAALVIAYALWSQRDGARPIAETATQETPAEAPTAARGDTAAPAEDTPVAETRAVDRASTAVDIARANTPGAPASTSAAVLDSAFFRDPAGAALRYAGPVRVSGIIATMVTPGDTPALSLEGRTRFNYMIVNFPRGYRERLAPLAKGQFIAVSCASAQSLGGTTILNGCALE